ncbi:hypothetical protein PMAYCL1PPCAC_10775, partial [Pristionchus mayeri]
SGLKGTSMEPCAKNQLNIWKQQISLVLGGSAFVFNGILLVSVLSNEKLRNRSEYRLMIALAFADFSEGVASFIGAVYRLPYYLSDDGCYKLATPLECMILPQNIIWSSSVFPILQLLVMIAVDHFIAITFPLFHVRNSSISNIVMISVVYGISILCMLYAWIQPIQLLINMKTLQRVCSTGKLIDNVYTIVIKYATGAASAISAIIHVTVTVKV